MMKVEILNCYISTTPLCMDWSVDLKLLTKHSKDWKKTTVAYIKKLFTRNYQEMHHSSLTSSRLMQLLNATLCN